MRTKNCKVMNISVEDELKKVKSVNGKKIEKPFRKIRRDIECELVPSGNSIQKKKNRKEEIPLKKVETKEEETNSALAGYDDLKRVARGINERSRKTKGGIRIIIGKSRSRLLSVPV